MGWLLTTVLFGCAMFPWELAAQGTPASPTAVWQLGSMPGQERDSSAIRREHLNQAPNKTYTLAELVDFAEEHNPETRVAWEEAKSRAGELGVARSALYPTLTAVALAASLRQAALIGEDFHRQTEGVFEPILHVEYLVFDLGGRSGAIDAAKADLLASDEAFNDAHRHIIYDVAESYYRLLNAQGQREAAEASLENAQAVDEDAKARLQNGLATKPDELEAAAAQAQAGFDLQAAVGAVDIARGGLATALGVDPATVLKVEGIRELRMPSFIANSLDQEIERAFSQRPDVLEQLARLRGAKASIREAKSEYFPTLSFKGDGGLARAYGQQDLFQGSYAEGEVWTAELELRWNIFDGTRREYRVAQANADRKAAQAKIDALRDQVADQVWSAFVNMQTALRQQQAAASLLTAAQESYESAHQAYGYGVRNLLDVVAAQKALAQARSEDVSARTRLLLEATGLAFQTGDLIQTRHWSPAP